MKITIPVIALISIVFSSCATSRPTLLNSDALASWKSAYNTISKNDDALIQKANESNSGGVLVLLSKTNSEILETIEGSDPFSAWISKQFPAEANVTDLKSLELPSEEYGVGVYVYSAEKETPARFYSAKELDYEISKEARFIIQSLDQSIQLSGVQGALLTIASSDKAQSKELEELNASFVQVADEFSNVKNNIEELKKTVADSNEEIQSKLDEIK